RFALVRRERRDDAAIALRGVDVGDALTAAVGAAVFIGRGTLAVAVLRHRQDELLLLRKFGHSVGRNRAFAVLLALPGGKAEIGLAFLLAGADAMEDRHRDHLVAGCEANSADALRIARLKLAHVGRLEA